MAQAMTELPKGMLNALSLPQLKLTMEQEQEWTKARTKFLWEVPGFCAVMFNMMNPHAKQEKAVEHPPHHP